MSPESHSLESVIIRGRPSGQPVIMQLDCLPPDAQPVLLDVKAIGLIGQVGTIEHSL